MENVNEGKGWELKLGVDKHLKQFLMGIFHQRLPPPPPLVVHIYSSRLARRISSL